MEHEDEMTRPDVKNIATNSIPKARSPAESNEEQSRIDLNEEQSNAEVKEQPENINMEQPRIFSFLILAAKHEDLANSANTTETTESINSDDSEIQIGSTKKIIKKVASKKRTNLKNRPRSDKPIKFDDPGDEPCTYEKYLKMHLPRIRKDHNQLTEKEALGVVKQLWNIS
ncbi:13906_t:CDS:1 [Acaulospora colombiana]|uniref:13906_t:CDS:1 n=1 Tax=Acaulospora colombiana TaxID=27376 RepID=A0ACA9LFH2_9GLOM|nr:13906_t:CDS:1 [Acaulospora colombiana]